MRLNDGTLTGPQLAELKRKTPTVCVRDGHTKVLADLAAVEPGNYTLYIMAHCLAGRHTVFNIQGVYDVSRTNLTPQALVSRLVEDGLPFNALNVKLFSCYGGAAGRDGEESYASKLHTELRTRGYWFVTVTAYTQPLQAASADPDTGHKRISGGARPSLHSVKIYPRFVLAPAAIEYLQQLQSVGAAS